MNTFEVMNVENVSTPPPEGGTEATTTVTAVIAGDANVKPPRAGIVLVSVGGFVAATVGAWLLFDSFENPSYFKVNSGYTALAALVLAAAAVERFLEPFSTWLLPKKEAEEAAATAKNKAAVAAADASTPGSTVQPLATKAAKQSAAVDAKSGERVIVFWAIASSVALVVPVGLGVFFLRAVGDANSQPNRFLDMVFTALVIGAGTKPLHDTIDRIQMKKEAAADGATAPT